MGGVIVSDQKQVSSAWSLAFDWTEEMWPYGVGVARLGSRDPLAHHRLKGGEQRDHATAEVITGQRARAFGRQRAAQSCLFEGLALAFLMCSLYRYTGRQALGIGAEMR